jgi:hypothetical protein
MAGVRWAHVFQEPEAKFAAMMLAASGFVVIFENALHVESSVTRNEETTVKSEAELREVARREWEAKNQAPERKIPNLGSVEYNFQTVKANLIQRDERWQQFGMAVVNGMPMTQSKWTGKGRPFSKPEFSGQMNTWLHDQIVKPKNRKGNSEGFTPKGERGWKYFKGLADGREWISLPYSEKQ